MITWTIVTIVSIVRYILIQMVMNTITTLHVYILLLSNNLDSGFQFRETVFREQDRSGNRLCLYN